MKIEIRNLETGYNKYFIVLFQKNSKEFENAIKCKINDS